MDGRITSYRPSSPRIPDASRIKIIERKSSPMNPRLKTRPNSIGLMLNNAKILEEGDIITTTSADINNILVTSVENVIAKAMEKIDDDLQQIRDTMALSNEKNETRMLEYDQAISQYKLEISLLEKKLEEEQGHKIVAKDEIATLRARLYYEEQQRQRLEDETTALRKKLDEEATLRKKLDEEAATLRKRLEEERKSMRMQMEEEVAKAREESRNCVLEEMSTLRSADQRRIHELKEENSALRSELEAERQKREEVQEEARKQRRKDAAERSKEIGAMTRRVEATEAELREAQERINELTLEQKQLQATIKGYQSQCAELKQELAEARDKAHESMQLVLSTMSLHSSEIQREKEEHERKMMHRYSNSTGGSRPASPILSRSAALSTSSSHQQQHHHHHPAGQNQSHLDAMQLVSKNLSFDISTTSATSSTANGAGAGAGAGAGVPSLLSPSSKDEKQQECKNCGHTFRKSENTPTSCRFHPGALKFVASQDRVCWDCCFAHRSAQGCKAQMHIS